MDTVSSSVAQDNLYASTYPVVKGYVTVGASQTLSRGAVLGIKTTGGQAFLVDKSKSDGTQNPNCILLDAVTTGSGETKVAAVALSGVFQTQMLTMATGTSASDIKDALRALNIYLVTTIADENAIV
jgi:hypothetical protein